MKTKRRILIFLIVFCLMVSPVGVRAVQAMMGDVDGSGTVDHFDAMYILQFYTGLIEKFPGESAEPEETEPPHVHDWVAATCTEPKHCLGCGTTVGMAWGHTTANGECERCGQIISVADQCSLTVDNALPCAISSYYPTGNLRSIIRIEDVTHNFEANRDGTVDLELTFSCYVISSPSGLGNFAIRLYDSAGRMVGSSESFKSYAVEGLYYTDSRSFSNLQPGEYTIKLESSD